MSVITLRPLPSPSISLTSSSYALTPDLAELRQIPIVVSALDLDPFITTCAVTTVLSGCWVLEERPFLAWRFAWIFEPGRVAVFLKRINVSR
jgi:hypothetical protein